MSRNLSLFVLCLFLFSATLSLSYEARNPEVEALIIIRSGLNDPHGVLNNWDEDSVDPCSWAMITCSPDNVVTGLLLQNNNISGQIPPVLGKLPNLQTLDLSNNSAVGNPLICGSHPVEGCSGSATPIPLSFSIDSSPDLQEEDLISLGNLRSFVFKELQHATDNFSSKNILGAGGFGNVYKGKLGDGTMVAVKRLKDVTGTAGESQFRTELELISMAVHRNLLRLIGYCATSNERLLVYPYMSNGSVASKLRGKPVLDWNARKRIAIGAARGLLYLHEQCDPKIIHRDVKAANVLLDDYCEAIVGDFGLAKLLDHAESHVTTAVRGTVGHIAPEYLSTGQSSEKTDVFGFGILLLELITGMRALEFGKTVNQKGAMLDWVKKIQQEKKVELLVDRELGSSYDRIEAGEMLQVALLCTKYLPAHRPKMSEVVRMLEGDGLAEKWAASHNHISPNTSFSLATKIQLRPTNVSRQDDNDHDHSSMFGMMAMDDDHDTHAMELSGPR
ncbi:hypothetical protein RJ639_008795 [Escallonia herrerae]|uniref:non-specific serine/threonine protein kinase n=1 Tax=Escallonia herrerae TaxID=1293975 RepID=A0AA89AV65_9ASTE|nr:hypothetical protein RJ639_008795 [Escallonia herrerae]